MTKKKMKRKQSKRSLNDSELKIIPIQDNIERKIVTGLIVSERFCQQLKSFYNPKLMKVDYARTVAGWCFKYFEEYRKAPEESIQEIYEFKRKDLSEAEADLIDGFLESISDDYETRQFNIQYTLDKTREYFDRRAVEEFFKEGYAYVRVGEVDRAVELRKTYREIEKENTERFWPLDPKEVKMYDYQNTENRLFRLEGVAGDFVGWLERGWLMSVMAPEKTSKSFWLEELGFAAIKSNLKVVWYSLEMNKPMLINRFYRRLLKRPSEKRKFWKVPILDCKKNQDQSCGRAVSGFMLRNGIGEKLPFSNRMAREKHKVCTKCRGERGFITDYWFKLAKKKRIYEKTLGRYVAKFRKKYGNNIVVRPFPPFGVNFDGIIDDLNELEIVDGFSPDVVIIDYFDILASESGVFSERDAINSTWKRGKNLADIKKCLVITADQAVKKGRGKQKLNQQDTSEDKRKDAHVDIKIAVNQTEEENRDGICRLGLIYHRHNKINNELEVLVTQQLAFAQPMLDSEWYPQIPSKSDMEK